MMKKIVFLLLFLFFSTAASSEVTYSLKLRANYHPEFLRIVLEGSERIISKGKVNQKDRDIIVRFPATNFIIKEKKIPIIYRIHKDAILFSPGFFSGFKVFTLKNPSRLVIDTYMKPKKRDVKRSLDALRKQWRKGSKTPLKPKALSKAEQGQGVRTVVIDPGHGGYESGLIDGKLREKNVVLDISKKLNALISKGDTKGFLTRKSDQYMNLGERIKFTNNKNTDIFISFHVGNHNGIVLYSPVITEPVPDEVKPFLVNKGQEDFMVKTAVLRDSIQQAIKENFGNDMVSTKLLPYSILSKIEAAALIIELPSFKETYYPKGFKTELAKTIYKGIYLYEENTAN